MQGQTRQYHWTHEEVKPCRYCGKLIFFKVLPSGKRMPVLYETMESHFIDCPGADKARKTR